MTVQIPNSQMGWFEQMIKSMGWRFHKEESVEVERSLETEVDELLSMFKTDKISQDEVNHECERVREELYDARKAL